MGISAMVRIKSKSDLLRGEVWQEDAEPEFQLMATASFGAKEFRLWKLSNALKTLTHTSRLRPPSLEVSSF